MSSFLIRYNQLLEPTNHYTGDMQWIGSRILYGVIISGFIWLPVAFATFAVGRRRASRTFWTAFAVAETIALLASMALWGVPRE